MTLIPGVRGIGYPLSLPAGRVVSSEEESS